MPPEQFKAFKQSLERNKRQMIFKFGADGSAIFAHAQHDAWADEEVYVNSGRPIERGLCLCRHRWRQGFELVTWIKTSRNLPSDLG